MRVYCNDPSKPTILETCLIDLNVLDQRILLGWYAVSVFILDRRNFSTTGYEVIIVKVPFHSSSGGWDI